MVQLSRSAQVVSTPASNPCSNAVAVGNEWLTYSSSEGDSVILLIVDMIGGDV